MSAINTMIAQMGQKNPLDGFKNGQALRQLIGVNLSHKMDMMPESERQDYANNSFFGRELNAHLRAQQAAKLKAEQDALKFNADLQKTESETLKNNSQAQGYGLDNSAKIISAAENAISHSAATGTKGGALASLGRLRDAGLITPEFYESEARAIESFTNPEEFKAYATSMLDPKYWMQTVDNAADNAQSNANNIRTTEVALAGQENQREIAAANRQQQLTIEQARIKMQQEGGSVQVFGGKAYFIDKQGNAKPVSDENGQHLTAPQKGGETPVQRMEREAKVENFNGAATQALEAAELATRIANDPNLKKAAGGWGVMARIPGTDARAMAKQIETLQSQVFLNQVEKMRGLGALTDFEGKKLESAIASLDINLDAKTLANNLNEISRIMQQSAQKSQNLAKIYSGDDVANPFMTEQGAQKGGKPNARSFFD